MAGISRLGPIQVRTAGSEVYQSLRQAILDGVLIPGQRLVEDSLAIELGASRTPVREALLMLEFEGLAKRQGKRLVVTTFTSQELRDIFEVRLVIEGYVTGRAAMMATKEHVRALKDHCDETEKRANQGFSSEPERIWYLVQRNREFHGSIWSLVTNSALETVVRSINDLPLLYRAIFWSSPDHTRLSLHYHRTIVGAVEHGDYDRARLVMQEHIYEARDMMLEYMDENGAGKVDEVSLLLQEWARTNGPRIED